MIRGFKPHASRHAALGHDIVLSHRFPARNESNGWLPLNDKKLAALVWRHEPIKPGEGLQARVEV